jgi:hypothetical protein
MAKQDLKDKIRSIAKKAYDSLTSPESTDSKSDSLKASIEKPKEKSFPILDKFPDLEPVILSLLTDQYDFFIEDIWWVAPRPTTFKIILANSQYFYLIYTQRSWIAQIEGKKYYLNNNNEEARAAEAIAKMLRYGVAKTEESPSASIPSGEDMPPPSDEEESSLPSPEFPEEGGEEEILTNVPV